LKIICAKALINIYSFLLLTSYFSLIYAQAPDTLWTKIYGGVEHDCGYSVQQTTDKGYIVTGYTGSFGSYEVYLIKTDSLGDTLWTKTYGGANNDWGFSVQQTSDKGYIIAGVTESFGSGSEVYLIKTDSLGDTLWTESYGGPSSEAGYSVQQTFDGGYIVAGYTWSADFDVYLIKTDSLGDSLWAKIYGGSWHDAAWSVQQTTYKGYIIVGFAESFGPGPMAVYLIKTDSLGDSLWARTYGGTGWDLAYAVQQTPDNGYIVTGFTGSFGAGGGDIYLIKTDSLGDTLWTKTYGEVEEDWGYSVQQTSDQGYIITGRTESFGAGSYDVYIVRTDSLGEMLWEKTCGGIEDDEGRSVQQTSDGGYIVAGFTYSFGAGYWDVYLIRLGPDTLGIEETARRSTLSASRLLEVYPNPFREKIQIRYMMQDTGCRIQNFSLKIYDVLGREVMYIEEAGKNSVLWDGRDKQGLVLPAGIYFCKINDRSKTHLKKVIKIK